MSNSIRTICAVVLTIILCQVTGSVANAQSGVSRIRKPFDRPTFSPYLNLFRSGNGPVMNYFGAVRPQQEFYSQNQHLNQELDDLQGRQNQQYNRMPKRIPGVYTMGVTGHSTGFDTLRSSRGGGQKSGSQLGGSQFGGSQYGGSQFSGDQSGDSPFGGEESGYGGGYGNPFGGSSGHSSSFGSSFNYNRVGF